MKRILPIVEGEGDMKAIPELVRRVAHLKGHFDVTVCRPHRRGDLPKVLSRFDDYFRTALLEECPILWVMDYDCDACFDQAADVDKLRSRAETLAQGTAFEFVFLVQEFESLFLSDHETTRKVFPDIGSSIIFPSDPEQVRDAKGWLSSARPKGFAYKPTQHQQKLAAQINLLRLRIRSPSYVRLESAVERLIRCQP
jgi:hypothetical protein